MPARSASAQDVSASHWCRAYVPNRNCRTIVWPKSPLGVQSRQPAPRLATLDGARIGFVWDYMFRGDDMFLILEEMLKKRYPDIRFVHWKEFGSTHSPQEHQVLASLPRMFREMGVDAVISGVGA